MVEERRKNGRLFQEMMGNHPDILIQQEIGESSWFGFSLVIRPGSRLERKCLLARLNELGLESTAVYLREKYH
jgi:CDP-6-deoxy-D-xylo-4-hexulose-3-dehydrase